MSLAVVRKVLTERIGAAFVNLVTETEPDMTGGKKCPLLGRIKKVSRFNGQINWKYDNAVNNQRGRENQPLTESGEVETFVPEARRWGQRLHAEMFPATEDEAATNRLLPFVAHKAGTKAGSVPSHKTVTLDDLAMIPEDELYLEMRVLKTLGHYYILDGKELSEAEAEEIVKPWLPVKKEGERQAVDKPVILRDYKMSSIVQMTLDGVTHTVR